MTTVNEIEAARKAEHDKITKAYYKDKTMSKAEFDSKHVALDSKHDITAASDYTPQEKTDLEKLIEYAKAQEWI